MAHAFRWQRSRRSTPLPAPSFERVGGLRQAALRRPRTRSALSGPVHASCRDLQSSARRSHRHPRDVPLERLRPWEQAAEDDFTPRGIPSPFPGTCSPAGPPPYSLLRLFCQSPSRRLHAALPNSVGGQTDSRCVSSRRTGGLTLPSLPRRDEGRRASDSPADSLRASPSGRSQ